jgi:spore germination protein YaaH
VVKRTRWVVLAALLLSSCQTHFVGGWLPWFASSRTAELDTITSPAASPLFNEVSLFWYGAHGAGSPLSIDVLGSGSSPVSLATSAQRLHDAGILVIPTIADGTGAGVMRGVIADPAARAAHEDQIVSLVLSNPNYDGIDLDYEVFAFGDRIGSQQVGADADNWVTFITELGAKLHAQNKRLTVTIPPTYETQGLNTTITHGYPFYNQQRIAPAVDGIRLMMYDWSVGSAGPMSPMFWVDAAIAYSNAAMDNATPAQPHSKMQLGIPAYGREWRTQKNSNEFCPAGAAGRSSITMKVASTLASAKPGAVAVRDNNYDEMTVAWDDVVTGPAVAVTPPVVAIPTPAVGSVSNPGAVGGLQPAQRLTPPSSIVSCTVHHLAWFPDAASLQNRAQRAVNAGWKGIFIWALGYETPDVLPALGNVGP